MTCRCFSKNSSSDEKGAQDDSKYDYIPASSFSSEVGIVGLKYVGDNSVHGCRRCLWSFFIIGAIAFMVYQILAQVQHFLTYPTKLTIKTSTDTDLILPTITVCNENAFVKSEIDYRDWFYNASFSKLIHQFGPYINYFERPNYTFADLDYYETFNWTDIYYQTGTYYLGNMIILCSIYPWILCDSDKYIQPVHTDMHFCTQIGGQGSLKLSQLISGASSGVWLILDASQNEYIVKGDPSAGFRIAIHEDFETISMENDGFRVSPGLVTSVSIEKAKNIHLPPKFGSCGEKKLKFFKKYTHANCRLECLAIDMIDYCNCTHVHIPQSGYEVCSPPMTYDCSELVKYMVATGRNILCECPVECEEITYTTALSFNAISNKLKESYFPNTTAQQLEKYVADNLAFVNIYRKKREYVIYETEQALDILTLLCNIGGALSLFLGTTFLTLYEIIEQIMLCCAKRKSRVSPTN